MSASGLDVFDRTVETTHVWLNEICDEIGPDKQLAWKVLSTVLHKLRDRLTINLAAHLGAQLPLLIRGVYYDQFEPGKMPSGFRSREEFVADVAKWLSDSRPVDPEKAVRAVFGVLSRHISEGQCHKVRDSLPKGLRQMWDSGSTSHEHEAARARHDERQPPERRDDPREERTDEPLILTEAQAV
ncbi:MAG: DUF2267 domain-containing protein [Sphingomicrobium sp.]